MIWQCHRDSAEVRGGGGAGAAAPDGTALTKRAAGKRDNHGRRQGRAGATGQRAGVPSRAAESYYRREDSGLRMSRSRRRSMYHGPWAPRAGPSRALRLCPRARRCFSPAPQQKPPLRYQRFGPAREASQTSTVAVHAGKLPCRRAGLLFTDTTSCAGRAAHASSPCLVLLRLLGFDRSVAT